MSNLEVASPEDLKRVMDLLPEPQPGEECYGCHRKVPKLRSDAPTGPRTRSVIHINEPAGEEGTLEQLMIGVIDRHKEQWPRDHAAMREGVGLEVVGGRNWRYYVVHFSLYAVLTVPGLEPTE